MDALTTSHLVKHCGRAVGFDRVGIARPAYPAAAAHYRAWLAAGYAGQMHYLARNADIRAAPEKLLPGARSAICVALNYGRANSTEPPERRAATGRVAQYARGRDYHVVIRRMLAEMTERLRDEIHTPFEARPCVDTAPVLERALAAAAGIGWVGKNTLVLHHELGSYIFLGVLLTTLDLPPDQPLTDRCGTCTRCLDACPTQAFPQPGVLDARRCISYLTIEHRDAIDADLQDKMGDWVFGCDVCQEVCPYNRKAPPATHPDVVADAVPEHVPLLELLQLRSGEYRRWFGASAARRARRAMWQRNAAIALGATSADAGVDAALHASAGHAVAAVSHAVEHALRRRQTGGGVEQTPPRDR